MTGDLGYTPLPQAVTGAGFLGWTGLEKVPTRNKKVIPLKRKEPEMQQSGEGVWDTVKSVGKKAAKYVAPVALGLAGAAAAHYLSKSKSGKSRDVSQGTDTSRFTDSSLPYANSETPSSYRDRSSEQVPLTPAGIQALLALKALHSAYEPSANHPWTSGGGVNWIPGKRQWDWLTGGSLVGPTTLAALAQNRHPQVDLEAKIRHLSECKHCQGKGIGKKLWNGIKTVGSEVYGAVKPYAVPLALAAGAAAVGHYALNKSRLIPNAINGISNRIGEAHAAAAPESFERLSEQARSPAAQEYERSGRQKNPFDRPIAQEGYWNVPVTKKK
jgi:hypothetical protein